MELKEYIKQVLESCDKGDVTIDVGITITDISERLVVNDMSGNRIRLTIRKK